MTVKIDKEDIIRMITGYRFHNYSAAIPYIQKGLVVFNGIDNSRWDEGVLSALNEDYLFDLYQKLKAL
jgi:hypothetical protein